MTAIYSKNHFLVSVAVGAVFALAYGFSLVDGVVAILGSGILGVGIDLDHFLIARIRTGSWDSLGYVVREPVPALTDQRTIFDESDVGKIPRLLSHTVLAGAIVGSLALVVPTWALLAGLVLYFHVLGDLLADFYQLYWEPTS